MEGKDIEIKITGIRPGGKLYEELLVDGKAEKTLRGRIMSVSDVSINADELEPLLSKLYEASSL